MAKSYLSQMVAGQIRIKDLLLYLLLRFTPINHKSRILYELVSTHNYFTERSLYLNLGYWKDSPKTLDDACQAMSKLFGEIAEFGATDAILDVGFGFADQDLFWIEHFSPLNIVGLNITPSQVELARKRVAEHHLDNRIDLQIGSATKMPFTSNVFDKVAALECAFHFLTREKFFQEAFRVLRPGGRVVIADIVPLSNHNHSINDKEVQLVLRRWRRFVSLPSENWYASDRYTKKLEKIGFENVQIISIRNHVYNPLLDYLSQRLHDPEITQRVNKPTRSVVSKAIDRGSDTYRFIQSLDYIIAVANKPMEI